jgi:FkbM family methyltransferase
MARASHWLVPDDWNRIERVRTGFGEGLAFEIYPRWETALWEGTFEHNVQAVLAEVLKPGIVFYDVGAGMGFYTCCAARTGARVFAFEPNQENAETVERHLSMNHLGEHVTLERKAVFSHCGTIAMRRPTQRHSHINAVVDERGEELVPTVTLDQFCCDHAAPDVCKVDVEGAESQVLLGAERTFSSHSVLLLCEVHDAMNAEAVSRWLEQRGYSLRWLADGGAFPKHLVAQRVVSNSGTDTPLHVRMVTTE